ncbi:MAG: purine-nucleoside phosphorylase [Verrucomicrobiota bacterium]
MSETALERIRDWGAETAIILGSGLSSIVGEVGADCVIDFLDVAELPRPSVAGHTGRFVLGEIGATRVIYAQGRVHLYEGFSARDVAAGVRTLASAGVKQLVLTNAAGSVNPDFDPGSWMMVSDHLNLTGTSPLIGAGRADEVRQPDAAAPRPDQQTNFHDMTQAYSPRLRETFRRAAREIGMALREGVYAGLIGPQYETPAEVRMLRALGADAVGMSTVMEVIQARALGMEVAAFSCLTNWAAGMGHDNLSHEEVLAAGKGATEIFARLLQAMF